MQGCVISCGTVVFFQKSRNLSRSLLTNNKFYCAFQMYFTVVLISIIKHILKGGHCKIPFQFSNRIENFGQIDIVSSANHLKENKIESTKVLVDRVNAIL